MLYQLSYWGLGAPFKRGSARVQHQLLADAASGTTQGMARNKNIPSNNPAVKERKRAAERLRDVVRDGNYDSLLGEPNGRIHHDDKFRERALRAVITARSLGMSHHVPAQLVADLGLPENPKATGWTDDDPDLPPPEPEFEPSPKVPDEDDNGPPF